MPAPGGENAPRVVRVDLLGNDLEVIAVGGLVGQVHPSPDGRSLALVRIHPKTGKQTIAIHGYVKNDDGSERLGEPRLFPDLRVDEMLWRPDSAQLALGLAVEHEGANYYARLHILDLESGELTRIRDSVAPLEREANGTVPFLWNEHGLFANSMRRVLRCDPGGGGCSVIYEAPRHLLVRGGTAVGGTKAYIFLSDMSRDPFESRGHELHEIDLVAGGGKMLLRLPDNVFIDSLDWIAD